MDNYYFFGNSWHKELPIQLITTMWDLHKQHDTTETEYYLHCQIAGMGFAMGSERNDIELSLRNLLIK